MYQLPLLRNPPPLMSSSISLNGDASTIQQQQLALLSIIGSTPSRSTVQVVAYQIIHEGEFKYIKNGPKFSILDSVELLNPVIPPGTKIGETIRFNLREIQDFRVIRDSGNNKPHQTFAMLNNTVFFVKDRKKKVEIDRTQPVELHLSTVVIHNVSQLKNLVQALHEVDVVGISLEGQNVCRLGQVSWILVTARKTLIPLDIFALSHETETIWDTLRKSIFENKRLVKIFHDCRRTADYLFHQHKIQLVNVFDTQIADAIIVKNSTGFHPAELRSLADILPIYNTRIPPQEIDYLKLYDNYDYTQNSPWLEKPLPRAPFLKYAALKVKHLVPLRDNLMLKMLIRFSKSVQAHADIQHQPDSTFQSQLQNPHVLPENLEAILVDEPTE